MQLPLTTTGSTTGQQVQPPQRHQPPSSAEGQRYQRRSDGGHDRYGQARPQYHIKAGIHHTAMACRPPTVETPLCPMGSSMAEGLVRPQPTTDHEVPAMDLLPRQSLRKTQPEDGQRPIGKILWLRQRSRAALRQKPHQHTRHPTMQAWELTTNTNTTHIPMQSNFHQPNRKLQWRSVPTPTSHHRPGSTNSGFANTHTHQTYTRNHIRPAQTLWRHTALHREVG